MPSKTLVLFILLLISLFLLGCAQTITKYQCQDGSVQDSLDLCPQPDCIKECPSTDCSTCPVETETKVETKTVTEKIYICPDGETEVKDIEDCTAQFLSEADYGLGDELEAGDFKWKFVKYTTASEIGEDIMGTFMGVKADGEFLIVDVEVENVGKSAKYLMESFVRIIDEQGREFSADVTAAFYLKPQGSSLSFDIVNPGIVKKGKIVFDVPSGLKIAKIRVSSNLLEDSFYSVNLFS